METNLCEKLTSTFFYFIEQGKILDKNTSQNTGDSRVLCETVLQETPLVVRQETGMDQTWTSQNTFSTGCRTHQSQPEQRAFWEIFWFRQKLPITVFQKRKGCAIQFHWGSTVSAHLCLNTPYWIYLTSHCYSWYTSNYSNTLDYGPIF